MSLGYAKPLYILPFEHRGPFQKGMFGWSGTLTAKQTAEIGQAKRVIYDGVNPPWPPVWPRIAPASSSTSSTAALAR
jgi:hypothetical protein